MVAKANGGPPGHVGTPASPASEEEWRPYVTLDIMSASQKAFNDTFADFYRLTENVAIPPHGLTTGWNTITQQACESLLVGKANRKLSVATIAYYARLMMAGAWKRTGETLIIDTNGIMRDAYHRIWACYLSGCSFDTFVVTDIQPDPETLMSIDNGKGRTDADGLEFSGLNGLSKVIASVVKIGVRYDLGYYEPHSNVKIHKMSPPEVVAYTQARPNLDRAVHGVVAEFKATLSALLPGKTDIACYVGWQIYDLFGVDVMEDFYTELADEEAQGAFGLLRNKLTTEVERLRRGNKATMDKRDVLAFLIKTFNAWQTGATLRRLILGTDEAFPQFVTPALNAAVGIGDEETVGVPAGVASHPVTGQSNPAAI